MRNTNTFGHMDAITAVIVDDESHARKMLKLLLMDAEVEVNVMAEAENAQDAISVIRNDNPQVVFLDVDMPGLSGLDLAQLFGNEREFEIIFITGHREHAVKAFRVNALDYLLKPVSPKELDNALLRLKNVLEEREKPLSVTNDKIALPMSDGLELVSVSDIISLEADRAYTTLHMLNGSIKLVSKRLKLFEDLLANNHSFKRVHRSSIINLDHLVKYAKSDSVLIMAGSITVPISKEHKPWMNSHMNTMRP